MSSIHPYESALNLEMKALFRKETLEEIKKRVENYGSTGVPQRLEFRNYILLLPKGFNTDDIRKLSDVSRSGGKVVSGKDWLD